MNWGRGGLNPPTSGNSNPGQNATSGTETGTRRPLWNTITARCTTWRQVVHLAPLITLNDGLHGATEPISESVASFTHLQQQSKTNKNINNKRTFHSEFTKQKITNLMQIKLNTLRVTRTIHWLSERTLHRRRLAHQLYVILLVLLVSDSQWQWPQSQKNPVMPIDGTEN